MLDETLFDHIQDPEEFFQYVKILIFVVVPLVFIYADIVYVLPDTSKP